MADIRTADSILEDLKQMSQAKQQLNPEIWLEAAFNLNILIGDEQEKLFTLQQEVSELENKYYVEEGNVASRAHLRIKATPQYRDMKIQEAKCKRIEELIRISKVRARISGGQ